MAPWAGRLAHRRTAWTPGGSRASRRAVPFVEFAHAGYRLADGRALLADLTLGVAEGEALALIGRSGAGKTTALRLVNALLMPSDGEVRVEDRPTTAWDPIRLRRR